MILALFVFLEGCGERAAETTIPRDEAQVVHVYNWADYVAESTIPDFERRTGIKVVYDVYDSSEVLDTKLLTGRSGYDVVFPSGSRISRLIQAGTLRRIDRSKLTNFHNLDPESLQLTSIYDHGNQYGLPYLQGTTGLGYNPALVEQLLGTRTLDGLAAVFDPKIASKLASCGITMLDSPETMFTLALMYLGRDSNSQRSEDIAAAHAVLARARPYVRYFHSSRFVDDLASGEVCVSIGWSGAIMQARTRGALARRPVEVVYVIPKEGAPLWIDHMAIPTDAPHPDSAHAFINYILEPQVAAAISNTVGQASCNAASLPFVAESLRNNPAVYPPAELRTKLELEPAEGLAPDVLREVTRRWTRIKANR